MIDIVAWKDLPEVVTMRGDLNKMRPSHQLSDDEGNGALQASVRAFRQEHTRRT